MPTLLSIAPRLARFTSRSPANHDLPGRAYASTSYRERQALRESAHRILATTAQYFLMPLLEKPGPRVEEKSRRRRHLG